MKLKLTTSLLLCCGLISAVCLEQAHAARSPYSLISEAQVDDHAADRAAIRAHIEKIFQAFVDRDCKTIRAMHSSNWVGFTQGARAIVHGIDGYMNNTARCIGDAPSDPNALVMVEYKLSEIDFIFYGDLALVPYVAEVTIGKQARIPAKLRALDIYAKENGEWTQVGSNISLHPDTDQAQRNQLRPLSTSERQALFAAREATWRAFFSNDRAQMEKLIPEEAVVISSSKSNPFDKKTNIFEGARKFAEAGNKLTRLEFPQTEIQVYGDTAILYTTYLFEVVNAKGETTTRTGRGTEIFVRRKGAWLNTGWHLQADN
jgi:ketosteroid isomerase-like protein